MDRTAARRLVCLLLCAILSLALLTTDVSAAEQSGWVKENGSWYYSDEASGTKQTGWIKQGGVWYYLASDGVMQTGWQQIGSVWYYLNASGAMQTGWAKIRGVWYYFNASGAMQTGWHKLGGVWYYFNPSGAMQTGWAKIRGAWYYFNAGGAMQTGWAKIRGAWYYFSADGAMQTGWHKLGGVWYYFNPSGAMQTGWAKIRGAWYYFNASGAMQTGWVFTGGAWYYLYDSGAMAKNETVDEFALGADGAMLSPNAASWKLEDGSWYYERPDGSRGENERTPDGFAVGQNGARLGRSYTYQVGFYHQPTSGMRNLIYIKTDNPDSNFNIIFQDAEGNRLHASRVICLSSVKDFPYDETGAENIPVDGGYCQSRGGFSADGQEENYVGPVEVIVKERFAQGEYADGYYEQSVGWIDVEPNRTRAIMQAIIDEVTTPDMKNAEKMDAIASYMYEHSVYDRTIEGQDGYCYLCKDFFAPWYEEQPYRFNSYTSPAMLCSFGEMIGYPLENLYGKYPIGTTEWYQYHFYVYSAEDDRYFMFCPPVSTGYIQESDIVPLDTASYPFVYCSAG